MAANREKKSRMITFRLDDEEKEKLIEQANNKDMSISEYIREKIFKRKENANGSKKKL